MNIIYTNNSINSNIDICNLDKKYFSKGKEAVIYDTEINGKNYIIKSIKKKESNILDILNKINKNIPESYKKFFSKILLIVNCDKYQLRVMPKYENLFGFKFLKNLNNVQKKMFLKNILLALFYLNHKAHLFHNDLFFGSKLKNIMYNSHKDEYIPIIIDYGCMDNKIYKRTIEVQNKVFPSLSEKNIYSEILIITYFYLFMVYNIDKNNKSNPDVQLNYIVEYILANVPDLNQEKFDAIFINFINKI